MAKEMRKTTYELGERFPSGVFFCFAAASLSTTGALGDVVREVADADLRSVEAGVCVEGASVGKLDWGLEPGSDEGGASGAATDATAVDMAKIVRGGGGGGYRSDSRWLLGYEYFKGEREAQETRLALQRSLLAKGEAVALCREKKALAGVEMWRWRRDGGSSKRVVLLLLLLLLMVLLLLGASSLHEG